MNVTCAKCGTAAVSVNASGFCNACRNSAAHPNYTEIDSIMRVIAASIARLRKLNFDSEMECSHDLPLREDVIEKLDDAWFEYCKWSS